MLKNFRLIAAVFFFLLTTLLFLDFTGVIHQWFGWLAKIQLIPALLATNAVIITIIVILTLFFGRIYCSVICPLGVLQDGISHLAGQIKGKKNRFRFAPAKSWLRYGVLALFIIALVAEISVFVSVLDPYAAYGRLASNFFSPLYRQGNNLLAFFAEKIDSYSFYSTEVWIKGWITFGTAAVTLFVVGILAWRNGRTYCNTICPVGAFLGFLSRFALFKLTVNKEKCTECRRCERNCKASCIDGNAMNIDYSRCVGCFNCVKMCRSDAIRYTLPKIDKIPKTDKNTKIPVPIKNNQNSLSRRVLISLFATFAFTKTLKAQQKLQGDGGLATIEDKKIPDRKTPIVPPGALGAKNMKTHCTACQLCVSACPNNVLRPSEKLATLMQPEMSFERGYCRLECTECSQVCPAGAIKPITRADKTAISIGLPVWIKEKCIVNTDQVQCNVCERHCPTGAITRIDREPNNSDSLKIPVIDKELCIGCGACEHLCPARPFSAIYVEGNLRHHSI
ncbi:MAG: 4Fe-4S binding protein [Planctomycetaceae bacterium]|jgi:ferredoxin|nr:4Fe-4S binding protein [Planctomycetaceae bacterium]